MAKATSPPGTAGTSYLVTGYDFHLVEEPEHFNFNPQATNWYNYGSGGTDAAQPGNSSQWYVGTGANDGTASKPIMGGNATDVMNGGGGNDYLDGGRGDDWVFGAAGNDLVYGGEGQDHVFGGLGTDQLFGGNGNDYLNGGAGNDVLTGGKGDDTFAINVTHSVTDGEEVFFRNGQHPRDLTNVDPSDHQYNADTQAWSIYWNQATDQGYSPSDPNNLYSPWHKTTSGQDTYANNGGLDHITDFTPYNNDGTQSDHIRLAIDEQGSILGSPGDDLDNAWVEQHITYSVAGGNTTFMLDGQAFVVLDHVNAANYTTAGHDWHDWFSL